jgi:uncharacterized protein
VKRTTFLASSAGAATVAAIPGIALASADLTLTTSTGRLAGTLELPSTAGPTPVVLIVAGSGPTDRNGNSVLLPGRNDALEQLAVALARRGVASLRYDKRGVGASAAALHGEANLHFQNYVDDAVAWVRELRAQGRFSRVAIAGHSEGALIGTLAAQRAHIDALATLEGAGRPAHLVIREQLHGAPTELRIASDRILDALVAGKTVDDVPPSLAALFRPPVQPYLISLFRYDPARELARISAPAAIVQGTADVQATRADGDALHAALPSARYVLVEGMNHVLKRAPDTSSPSAVMAGYTDPSLPVEDAVVETVAALALQGARTPR